LVVNTGLYAFNVTCEQQQLVSTINTIYGDATAPATPSDFEVKVASPTLLRRFFRPQTSFYCDQHSPFKPLPASQAYAILEWGMNWCIATHDHTRLLVHAAVLVKDNQAIIFPAVPGSGKSTLTAYLALSGWSLYSDEMAIIDLETGLVSPLYRPVCLKNNSIDLVKKWFPDSVFTSTWKDTHKGDVAHLKASSWSNYTQYAPTEIVAVVFPKFIANSELTIYSLDQLQAFETLSKNAFNYGVLGGLGFNVVNKIIKRAALFEIEFGDLRDVEAFLSEDIIK